MHCNKLSFVFGMLAIDIHIILSHFATWPYNNSLVWLNMFLQAIKLGNKQLQFFIFSIKVQILHLTMDILQLGPIIPLDKGSFAVNFFWNILFDSHSTFIGFFGFLQTWLEVNMMCSSFTLPILPSKRHLLHQTRIYQYPMMCLQVAWRGMDLKAW